mmetsp:Transcript_30476/g.81216  ORF Transcript_30476/g.81216 Transcript_30476/m.81216 type:complete len:105 (+) Transcript_30476:1127-1441(+)
MFNGSGWTLSWLPDTTSVVGVYNLVDFPDVIVAATEGGRIWRSSNAGENFTLVADFSQQGISFSGISGRSPSEESAAPPRLAGLSLLVTLLLAAALALPEMLAR